MIQPRSQVLSIGAFALLTVSLSSPSQAAAADNNADIISQGKQLAFDRKKGNCLACHSIEGGNLPGNIGPPLVKMKQRYPNKQRLRAQIWDATLKNPNTIMPPYGRHQILTEDELNKLVDFIYSL